MGKQVSLWERKKVGLSFWETSYLGMEEDGTEEGLADISAQCHMDTSPAQMYRVVSVCLLDRGYSRSTPEDLRAKSSWTLSCL